MDVAIALPVGASPTAIAQAVERLIVAPALAALAAGGRPLPRLRETAIRYRREPRTPQGIRERWQTPAQTLALGYGDCEDLAAYRTVELRRTGEDAGARVDVVDVGERYEGTCGVCQQREPIDDAGRMLAHGGCPGEGDVYIPGTRVLHRMKHAVVRRSDGRIEDTMREAIAREATMDNAATVDVTEHEPGTYVTTMSLRGKRYEVTIRALGDSKTAATERAGFIARQILKSPIMSALLPPQAHAAIKVASAMGKVAKRFGVPGIKGLVGKLRGPGAQRLARALGGG